MTPKYNFVCKIVLKNMSTLSVQILSVTLREPAQPVGGGETRQDK